MSRQPASDRMRRVNEALHQVLADAVEELSDPGLGFVTVTAVRAGADLGQATVFVSVLGNARKRASAMAALERARGLLQQRVARELHFKRTPLLTFRYDETTDRALRLSQLIDQAAPAADEAP